MSPGYADEDDTQDDARRAQDVCDVHAEGVLQNLEPGGPSNKAMGTSMDVGKERDNASVNSGEMDYGQGFDHDGRFIMCMPNHTEAISRALEWQWKIQTLKFKVHMSEVSDTLPGAFVRGEAFENLINQLVCFQVIQVSSL